MIKEKFQLKYNTFFQVLESNIDLQGAGFIYKMFYLFVLFYTFLLFTFLTSTTIPKTFLPIWPVWWAEQFTPEFIIVLILVYLITCSLLTLLRTDLWLLRLATFIGIFEMVGYLNSFGKISHSEHLLVLISFLLIFLPQKWGKKDRKKQVVKAFFSCQLIMMITYTLSGIWKVENGIFQLLNNQVGSFHPEAMSYQIAARLLETNSQSILGEFLIKNVWIAWPLYLSSIYLEIFSIAVVFKPSLHKLWGVFLIILHVFIYLAMAIPFTTNIFLLGLFMINSPFSKKSLSITDISGLPLISFLLKG